jgi:hypothetical protein
MASTSRWKTGTSPSFTILAANILQELFGVGSIMWECFMIPSPDLLMIHPMRSYLMPQLNRPADKLRIPGGNIA